MGFLDKLFGSKKKQNQEEQKEGGNLQSFKRSTAKYVTLKELVIKEFKLNGLNIEIIQLEYVDPYFSSILKNDYQKKSYEYNPEAFREKYFMFFSISYLLYKNPKTELIEEILTILFDKNKPNSEVRELLRSSHRGELNEHPEKQSLINTGSAVLRIYHALYFKKDKNFSSAAQVQSNLNQARDSHNKNDFSFLLEVATRYTCYETPWVLVYVANYCINDYKTNQTTCFSDKKEEVSMKIQETLESFNQTYMLGLKLDDLLLLSDHIPYIELNQTFLKANYKDRKKLGLKEVGELVPFLDRALNSMPNFMNTWIYLGSFYLSSNVSKLYKEITDKLLTNCQYASQDFDRWLLVKEQVTKDHNKAFYSPLFEAYVKGGQYSAKATGAFQSFFYTLYGINESKALPKKIIQSLCTIADSNPNMLEREFMKQCYNSPVSVSNFNSSSIGLYTSSKNAREEGVLHVHSQFSTYVPSSLKSVNKGQYYQEDGELFVLNIDGEDHMIPNSFTGALNQILSDRKTGVRIVPVPIKYSEGYSGSPRYITTLSLINLSQFRYLIEQYIPTYYPELKNAQAFQSISFVNTEGKALHDLKGDDTFIDEDQIFSAGFANDVTWTWFKETYIDHLRSKQKWYKAMDTLITFTGTKKPNKKWVSDMNSIIDEFGEDQYFDELNSLIYESREEKSWFFDEYNKTLKGMIWSCVLRSTERSLLIVKTVTELSYVKISGVGPRSTKTGNFCMEAMANSPSEIAYGLLQLMRLNSKYPRFVKAIDKFIEKYKENNDGNIEELEDKALPDFGFKEGIKIYDFKDAFLQLSFKKGKLVKTYVVNGKTQKTIPSVLKLQHAARFKEVNAEIKQITEILKSLQERLKSFWLYNRTWKFADWNKYIFKHELMNPLIENMVWMSVDSDEVFISLRDRLAQTNGAIIELDDNEKMCLWHPIMASSDEIAELQAYSKKNKIIQLEKQIDRELYALSKDELAKDENVRFANQQVEVRKLMALANSSNWLFTYVHEDVSWPRIYLKELDMTAHFKCNYDRNATYIPTAEFFISKGNTTKITYNMTFDKLKLSDVHPTTLSEICRDIDMFVSVANQIKK